MIENVTNVSQIAELINYINQTGGIPITVTQVTQQSWLQYLPSLLMSSIFVIWWLGNMIQNADISFLGSASLKKIKKITKRHVVMIKHTESSLFDMSMIDQKVVRKVMKAMQKFKGKPFDLVLHTPGGDIFSSLYLSRLLKKYPGEVRVFVPVHAMSGGTLLALSCKKLYMTDHACLGPVDPQLGSFFSVGSAKGWKHIVKFKKKKAEDSTINFAMMGEQYTKTIRTTISELLAGRISSTQQKKLADFLTNGNIEHGHHLTPEHIRSFGLEVFVMPKKLAEYLIKIVVKKGGEGVHYC